MWRTDCQRWQKVLWLLTNLEKSEALIISQDQEKGGNYGEGVEYLYTT